MKCVGLALIGAGLLVGAAACSSDKKSAAETAVSAPTIVATQAATLAPSVVTPALATLPPVTLAPLTQPPLTLATITTPPVTTPPVTTPPVTVVPTAPPTLPETSAIVGTTWPPAEVQTSIASAGPPCDLAVIVAQTETGFDGITPVELHCAADWAAWSGAAFDPTGSDGFFAVAQWDGAAWQLRNLGTSGVCTDAEVPVDLWPALRCFE